MKKQTFILLSAGARVRFFPVPPLKNRRWQTRYLAEKIYYRTHFSTTWRCRLLSPILQVSRQKIVPSSYKTRPKFSSSIHQEIVHSWRANTVSLFLRICPLRCGFFGRRERNLLARLLRAFPISKVRTSTCWKAWWEIQRVVHCQISGRVVHLDWDHSRK